MLEYSTNTETKTEKEGKQQQIDSDLFKVKTKFFTCSQPNMFVENTHPNKDLIKCWRFLIIKSELISFSLQTKNIDVS